MHNMVRLELHQLAFADFAWQGRNTHFFNRLFLVLAGEGEVRNHTGGERLALRPGFGVFLPEGLDLGFEFRPGLRFLSCHFNLSVLPGVDLFGQERHCREFPVDPGALERIIGNITSPPEWGAFGETEAFLWSVIGHLPLPAGTRLAEFSGLAGRYGGLLSYIREHLSARLTIDRLAEEAGLSRGRLSRNFSRDFSMPLKSFLQKELAAQASRYLLGSPLSVREIAERLEFSSEYYFSNFFRRCTGSTPTAFRKANPGPGTLPPERATCSNTVSTF